MSGPTTTFALGDNELSIAVAALADLGFQFDPARTVDISLLDSFDGRLHRAGLRLELHEADGLELVLTGDDTVTTRLRVAAQPRFSADLPAGPFRARLAAILDVRALLEQLRITTRCTPAVWRDHIGKVICEATIHETVRVAGRGVDVDAGRLPPSMIEVHEVVGYRKRARQSIEVLDGLGLERVDGDTLTAAAAVAGVDPAGFSESPTVPLDPAMPALEGLRDVLANLAETMMANWQGTIDRVDPEFLHDLRVAVRRTRSVLAEGKSVLPATINERARERFGWLGDLTGPARDLDVYLIEWDDYTGQLDGEVVVALAPVHALLVQQRDAAYAALVDALQSAEAAELMTTWRGWLRVPGTDEPPGSRADRPLGRVVAKRIVRAHTTLIERGRQIRPDTSAEEVHSLRKDAKKLRYLLECFGGLLPEGPLKKFVRRLKALQDNLGEHQDAEVHVAQLRVIARDLADAGASSDTMVAIGQLAERLDQRRIEARAEFAGRFADYDTSATRSALDAVLHGIGR